VASGTPPDGSGLSAAERRRGARATAKRPAAKGKQPESHDHAAAAGARLSRFAAIAADAGCSPARAHGDRRLLLSAVAAACEMLTSVLRFRSSAATSVSPFLLFSMNNGSQTLACRVLMRENPLRRPGVAPWECDILSHLYSSGVQREYRYNEIATARGVASRRDTSLR